MVDHDYLLAIEGKRDFVKVQIESVDLYFRCKDDKCDRVTSVKINFADGYGKFHKHYQCACTKEFRMYAIYNDPLAFTFFGDFTLDRESLTDQDISWTGYAFGVRFPIKTTHEGCWTMDQILYDKIAPICVMYPKRNIAQERVIAQVPEFEILSPSGEDDEDLSFHPNFKSKCLKKITESDRFVFVDVLALRPNVVGLHVVVEPVVLATP